jgi:predicted transposase/invertase (TIGR01784 family)
MPKRYLNPKVDLAFKRVFGEHIDLLSSFLNALLPLPEDAPIVSLEYLPTEHVPELPGLFKNSVVDVKCKDTKGRIFVVEIQMIWSASFEQRIIFSDSQAFVKQLYAGQTYHYPLPAYALVLTTSTFDNETHDFYHHYKHIAIENNNEALSSLEFVIIELSKFKPTTQVDKLMRIKWLRFMSEVTEQGETLGAEYSRDEEIQTALRILETSAFTEGELEAYHSSMDKMRIEPALYADAKAEGRANHLVDIVKDLHKNGMSIPLIRHITQLPEAVIRDLINHESS